MPFSGPVHIATGLSTCRVKETQGKSAVSEASDYRVSGVRLVSAIDFVHGVSIVVKVRMISERTEC